MSHESSAKLIDLGDFKWKHKNLVHENRFLNCYSSNILGAAGATEVSPVTERALKLSLPCLHWGFFQHAKFD